MSRDATLKKMEDCISNWCIGWRYLKYSAIVILFSDRNENDTFLRENGGFLVRSLKQES